MKQIFLILLIFIAIILVLFSMVGGADAASIVDVQTAARSCNQYCRISTAHIYANGISYTGVCQGNHWFALWATRFGYRWHTDDYVTVCGIPLKGGRVDNARILGMGWKW